MKQRSPIAVFLLGLITGGLYSWYWIIKTKGEMNKLGEKIPTAWIWLIPFVSIWWMWKYSEGVEHVTGEKLSAILTFVLLFLLGIIGHAIIQDSFNKIVAVTPSMSAPFDQSMVASQPIVSQPAVENTDESIMMPPTTPVGPSSL
jgi:hypothetical protein